MPLFGGADKIIIGEVQRGGQIAEVLTHLIGKGFGINAFIFGRFLHLLPMFIRARQKHHVKAIQPFEPRQGIASQGRVSVTDMRLIVHIINGRGQVVGFRHEFLLN